jgi:hypothetical protein
LKHLPFIEGSKVKRFSLFWTLRPFGKIILLEDDMNYTFEILGVSPTLTFFNQQQELLQQQQPSGVEYLANRKCTLDAFVASVETVSPIAAGMSIEL